jgi:hypothetical protein
MSVSQYRPTGYLASEVISKHTQYEKLSKEQLRCIAGADVMGIICTSHAIEGLDLDSPLNAILLSKGKSVRQVLQKCGKITRPDKRRSIIINIYDQGISILPKHARERSILNEFDSGYFPG